MFATMKYVLLQTMMPRHNIQESKHKSYWVNHGAKSPYIVTDPASMDYLDSLPMSKEWEGAVSPLLENVMEVAI